MTVLEQLRQAAELLPAGASVTLTREALLAALGGVEPVVLQTSADLTVVQVSERFHRSPSTVRGWLEAGRFPGAYKLNRRDWRVPTAAVDAFEARQREPAASRGPGPDLGAWRRHRTPGAA